ncbi:MAG: PQQ-binding-like beta-propeller repeat protein [Planctomycetes bacterium]|nr:PQQ-binding-like beta-propeller repeat protein [Planctomycetota bacterium]
MKVSAILFAGLFCSLLSFALSAAETSAELENWPQWRGPLGTGTAPMSDPPVEWSESKNIRWKVEVPGRGTSSPIVWGDRVFLLTAIDTGRQGPKDETRKPNPATDRFKIVRPETYQQFAVLCLDRASGSVRWQQVAAEAVPHQGHHPDHGHASASPTTDGQRLYASFGSRGVHCYDLDGKLLWNRDLGRLDTKLDFGEGSSPAVADGRVVLVADHEGESFVVCLDAKTGDTLWQNARDEGTGWSTPRIVEHNGRKQVITNATKRARSYDLETGELLWECGGQSDNAIPSPVAADGLAFCMSGFRTFALVAVPLDARGDLTDSDRLAWKRSKGTPYVPSPLLVNGRLYFTQANSAIMTSLGAKTGEAVMDQTRLPGLDSIYASPVSAAGRVYFVGRNGTSLVIKEGATLEVLATNELDEPIDASPAIAGRELFLRGQTHLYCVAE